MTDNRGRPVKPAIAGPRPDREYFTCSHCGDGPWHFSWCFESGPFAYGHDGQTLHDYRKVKNGLCPNCSGAD